LEYLARLSSRGANGETTNGSGGGQHSTNRCSQFNSINAGSSSSSSSSSACLNESSDYSIDHAHLNQNGIGNGNRHHHENSERVVSPEMLASTPSSSAYYSSYLKNLSSSLFFWYFFYDEAIKGGKIFFRRFLFSFLSLNHVTFDFGKADNLLAFFV
jgi:hypothetical protein